MQTFLSKMFSRKDRRKSVEMSILHCPKAVGIWQAYILWFWFIDWLPGTRIAFKSALLYKFAVSTFLLHFNLGLKKIMSCTNYQLKFSMVFIARVSLVRKFLIACNFVFPWLQMNRSLMQTSSDTKLKRCVWNFYFITQFQHLTCGCGLYSVLFRYEILTLLSPHSNCLV